MKHFYLASLALVVATQAAAQGARDIECRANCQSAGSDSRPDPAQQIQQERARLQQQSRELEQQIQREHANHQRLQSERARQQREERDRNTAVHQQILNTYQREMARLEQQRLQEEAAQRERASQAELEAMTRKLDEIQEAMRNQAATAAAPVRDDPPEGSNSQTTAPEEPNPFAADAKAAEGIKDPSQSYVGESCSYFTRPMVEADGARLNTYAEGSMVCYGTKMYRCRGGRWEDAHRCDMYANWQRNRAEALEGQ